MNPFHPTRTGSSILLGVALIVVAPGAGSAAEPGQTGSASWYGEEHRGRLMANGKPFDPDKLTAASWFYPLGTKLVVELAERVPLRRSVVVTVTDRGPAQELVRKGRIIDLSLAAFRQLASADLGLVVVSVQPVTLIASAKLP